MLTDKLPTPAGVATLVALVLGWLGVRDAHFAEAVREVVAGGAFLVGAVFVHGHHKVRAAMVAGQAQVAAAQHQAAASSAFAAGQQAVAAQAHQLAAALRPLGEDAQADDSAPPLVATGVVS